MLAKAIEASLGDSRGPSMDRSTQRHHLVDFIISPIEKENIQLFGELMTRLSGSRDATRDLELEKLAVEMHSMLDKLRYAHNKDPLVPFPGDITKTISMLEDALAKWARIPTSPKDSPVQGESSNVNNNLSNGPNDSKYNQSARSPQLPAALPHPPTSSPNMQFPTAPFPPQPIHGVYPGPYHHPAPYYMPPTHAGYGQHMMPMMMPGQFMPMTQAPNIVSPPQSVSTSKKDSTSAVQEETPLIDL